MSFTILHLAKRSSYVVIWHQAFEICPTLLTSHKKLSRKRTIWFGVYVREKIITEGGVPAWIFSKVNNQTFRFNRLYFFKLFNEHFFKLLPVYHHIIKPNDICSVWKIL